MEHVYLVVMWTILIHLVYMLGKYAWLFPSYPDLCLLNGKLVDHTSCFFFFFLLCFLLAFLYCCLGHYERHNVSDDFSPQCCSPQCSPSWCFVVAAVLFVFLMKTLLHFPFFHPCLSVSCLRSLASPVEQDGRGMAERSLQLWVSVCWRWTQWFQFMNTTWPLRWLCCAPDVLS